MRSRSWLVAGLVLVLTLPSLLCSASGSERPQGAVASARADAPWFDVAWKCRMPLTIDNTKCPENLAGYQVWFDIPYDADMKPDFSDLRFVQYYGSSNLALPFWLETREAGKHARAHVNVSFIAASSSSTIHMYYGNPQAGNASDGQATFLFFDDFEDGVLDPDKWGPLHACDAGVTLSETGGMLDFTVSSAYQWTGGCIVSKKTLPKENYVLETRLKFTNYYQSAYGAYAGFTNDTVYMDENYGNPLDLVSARLWDYTRNGWYLALSADDIGAVIYGNTQINIRNVWYRMKTYYTPGTYAKAVWNMLEPPYTNQSLEMSGSGGVDPNYIILGIGEYNTAEDTYFDHILLRKHAPAEPTVKLGAEERPYSFLSFTVGPDDVSEGDTVTLSAMIDNPVNLAIPVNLSFWEGDEFADATLLNASSESLRPGTENNISVEWKAAGGNHTFWFVLEGALRASADLSVNWIPTLDFIPNQLLMQSIPFSLHITARDRDGDQLAWSEDSDLFDFKKTDNKGADISFVPSNDDVGVHLATITVTDPHGRSASQGVGFTVVNGNDAPVLEFIPDMTVVEGNELRYNATASDPDQKWGDTLTFSDDTVLFEIDAARGNFSFVPTNLQVGKYSVEISVSDNQSATASRRFSLTVLNFNDPPVIEPVEPQTAKQGKLWQVLVKARDPDQDNIAGDRLRFSDGSPLFDIDPQSGLISFTPANKDVGDRSCNITVSDLAGATATTRLSLTVVNVNDPPVLAAVQDQVAVEDRPYELFLNASDIDLAIGLDNLTFSDDSPLFDIDPLTGRIGFTPGNDQVGRYTVKVKVTDRGGESATRTFVLVVQNVNDPPFDLDITSLKAGDRFWEGDTIWFNASASDIDVGTKLTYTWLDNGVEMGTGRSFSQALPPGAHQITLQVSDGNETVSLDVDITVAKKAPPVTPAVTSSLPWPALLAAVLIAAVAGGVVVLARRRKKEPPALPSEAAVTAPAVAEAAPARKSGTGARAAAAVVAPAGAAAAAAARDGRRRAEAKKAVAEAEDAVADALAGGRDTSEVEVDLELSQEALKEGDFAAALKFAADARAGLERAAPEEDRKERPDVGMLKCPSCDEELQPEWPTCPVCGYKTRGD